MERDCVISHGAGAFLKQSMLERGDDYYVAICNKTGTIAAYNSSKKLFYSLFADGPLKFNGTTVDNLNIENISNYGRSFSVIRIPYSFKLLIHELQTMNIQMRIITEDNIDQFESLCFKHTQYIDQEKILKKKTLSKSRIEIGKDSILDVSDSEGQEEIDEVEELRKSLENEEDNNEEEEQDIDSEETGIPEDDDESDLSPETIESIRKAEEYAQSMQDSDSEEDEPLNLGEDLTEDALQLEDIEKATGSVEKKISDMKRSVESSNQEQIEQLDELEKSVKKEKLKAQGIIIEDSDDKKNENNSLLLDSSNDGDENDNNDDKDNNNEEKVKPIVIN